MILFSLFLAPGIERPVGARAVLAAADLDQTLPPADVVRDYFEKAGMIQFLKGDPIVDEGLNYRIVTAQASVDMPLLFADLPRVFMNPFESGNSTLLVSGSSTAEERVSNVEISLVLDVSSSMQHQNRFTNLVPAAHDFIDTVMANNGNIAEGLVTLSTVAYSHTVNPGPAIANQMSLSNHHAYSHCPIIPDNMYDSTEFPMAPSGGGSYTRLSHFDYGAETLTHVQPITRPWCFTGSENEIIAHSVDVDRLKDWVSDLTVFGNTAIDLGMKWGIGLLDPSTRPVVSNLVSGNHTGSEAQGRPLDYDFEDGVLKVAVLMTDGDNTSEFDLKEPYKSGMSTIWFWREYEDQPLWDVPRSRISIQYEGMGTSSRWDDKFFNLDSSSWNRYTNFPRGTDQNSYRHGSFQPVEASEPGGGIHYTNKIYHASWQDIYAGWVRTRIYSEFFNEPYSRGAINYNTYVATFYAHYEVAGGSASDQRLARICGEAKDEGVIIYTVAFEASWRGRQTMESCASSPGHYFDVAGTDISRAFAAIASDIRALKLTQ